MKILMLCGVFAAENEAEVVAHARAAVEFSANVFQSKLIEGFRSLSLDFQVLSAPFVGSYPNASDMVSFRGFSREQTLCQYVAFNNIWGIRNFSRAASLKKALEQFIRDPDPQKLILCYCAHTPFLEAAVYAKGRDSRIRICMYVPDLPNYMNLSAKRSLLYDVGKKYDIAVMTRFMKKVDSFVLLTAQMKDCLPVADKPWTVIEGVVTAAELGSPVPEKEKDELVRVVYTGKLNEKFGVKTLVDGFCRISDPRYRLVLCGRGDCEGYIAEKARSDGRIQYLGQIPAAEAKAWTYRADVLVNPRRNNEEYTKYSFPSKNVEYLLSGNPVVAYMLSGMPERYREFLYEISPELPPEEAICRSLQAAVDNGSPSGEKYEAFCRYARQKLAAERVARTVLELSGFEARQS